MVRLSMSGPSGMGAGGGGRTTVGVGGGSVAVGGCATGCCGAITGTRVAVGATGTAVGDGGTSVGEGSGMLVALGRAMAVEVGAGCSVVAEAAFSDELPAHATAAASTMQDRPISQPSAREYSFVSCITQIYAGWWFGALLR